jgi:hypothetical protein
MTGWTYRDWQRYNDWIMRELIVFFPYYCRIIMNWSLGSVMARYKAKADDGTLCDCWTTPVNRDVGVMVTARWLAREQAFMDKHYARVQACRVAWEAVNAPGYQPLFDGEWDQTEQALEMSVEGMAFTYNLTVRSLSVLCMDEVAYWERQ